MDAAPTDALNDKNTNQTKTLLTRPEQFQGVPPLLPKFWQGVGTI